MENDTHSAISAITENAIRHATINNKWHGEYNPEHLLAVLIEEVGELSAAIHGKGEDSAQYELIQIGGIVVNWLSLFSKEDIEYYAQMERERHPILLAVKE